MALAGSGDGEQLAVGIAGHAGRSAIDRKTGAGSIPEAATVSSLLLPAHTDLCVDCRVQPRSEEHTSELQSLMRISYAVFCLTKKNKQLALTQQTVYAMP